MPESRAGKGKMAKVITVTLQTPKGTQWNLQTTDNKIATVRKNAKRMGYKIVKVSA